MGICWESQPTDTAPKKQSDFIGVLRLKPGGKTSAVMLGDLAGIWTHWVDRTQPCYGRSEKGEQLCEEGDCPYWPRPRRKRWYGPGATWEQQEIGGSFAWRLSVLELTEENESALRGLDTFGLHLELWRGKSNTSPLLCRLHASQPNDLEKAKLPRTFDVKPILLRLWGVQAPRANQDNPDLIKFRKDVG